MELRKNSIPATQHTDHITVTKTNGVMFFRLVISHLSAKRGICFKVYWEHCSRSRILNIPYPTAFPYGNGMVLHFYQQQESSTTKTVHKVINKGLKTYV